MSGERERIADGRAETLCGRFSQARTGCSTSHFCSHFIDQSLVIRPCPTARVAGKCGLAVTPGGEREQIIVSISSFCLCTQSSVLTLCVPGCIPKPFSSRAFPVLQALWSSISQPEFLLLAQILLSLVTWLHLTCFWLDLTHLSSFPSNPCLAHVSGTGPSHPWYLPAIECVLLGWEPILVQVPTWQRRILSTCPVLWSPSYE